MRINERPEKTTQKAARELQRRVLKRIMFNAERQGQNVSQAFTWEWLSEWLAKKHPFLKVDSVFPQRQDATEAIVPLKFRARRDMMKHVMVQFVADNNGLREWHNVSLKKMCDPKPENIVRDMLRRFEYSNVREFYDKRQKKQIGAVCECCGINHGEEIDHVERFSKWFAENVTEEEIEEVWQRYDWFEKDYSEGTMQPNKPRGHVIESDKIAQRLLDSHALGQIELQLICVPCHKAKTRTERKEL